VGQSGSWTSPICRRSWAPLWRGRSFKAALGLLPNDEERALQAEKELRDALGPLIRAWVLRLLARRRSGYTGAMFKRTLPASALMAWCLAAWLATGCHDEANCEPGETCECSDFGECYLGCDGDRCNQQCHNLNKCGGVCEDDCTFHCHDMDDCSSSCGDDCKIECNQVDVCGVICGESCDWSCHDVSRCGGVVGNGSTVDCDHISSCEVECEGECRVDCHDASTCEVKCNDGASPINCGNGRLACGSCSS
jgi:hypothetical protein